MNGFVGNLSRIDTSGNDHRSHIAAVPVGVIVDANQLQQLVSRIDAAIQTGRAAATAAIKAASADAPAAADVERLQKLLTDAERATAAATLRRSRAIDAVTRALRGGSDPTADEAVATAADAELVTLQRRVSVLGPALADAQKRTARETAAARKNAARVERDAAAAEVADAAAELWQLVDARLDRIFTLRGKVNAAADLAH